MFDMKKMINRTLLLEFSYVQCHPSQPQKLIKYSFWWEKNQRSSFILFRSLQNMKRKWQKRNMVGFVIPEVDQNNPQGDPCAWASFPGNRSFPVMVRCTTISVPCISNIFHKITFSKWIYAFGYGSRFYTEHLRFEFYRLTWDKNSFLANKIIILMNTFQMFHLVKILRRMSDGKTRKWKNVIYSQYMSPWHNKSIPSCW